MYAYITSIYKTQAPAFPSPHFAVSRASLVFDVRRGINIKLCRKISETSLEDCTGVMLSLLLALLPLAVSGEECMHPTPDAGFTNAAYEGTWYEVGKIQTPGGAAFQKDCVCDALKFHSEESVVSSVCVWGGGKSGGEVIGMPRKV